MDAKYTADKPAFAIPASRGRNYLTDEEDVVIDPQSGMSYREWLVGMALSAGGVSGRDAVYLADAAIKELVAKEVC